MRELFQQECVHLLTQSLARIEHCVNQLNHQQLWWRPNGDKNSVGIILRHVTGNLEQWAVCGVTETADHRHRDGEFDSPDQPSADQLLRTLADTVSRAKQIITSLSPDTFAAPRTIQGFNVSVLGSLMHTIPHLVGHTHQIVTLTRLQLADNYQFHWDPEAARNKVPL